MTTAQVRSRVEHWLEQPHVRVLAPLPETFMAFFDLLDAAGLGGNLTTDAMIAAQALEHGAIVLSNDRDFGRFPGVRWENPLA